MNDQRKVIYEQRSDIMDAEALDDVVLDMRHDTVNTLVAEACPQGSYPEHWNIEGLKERAKEILGVEAPIDAWVEEDGIDPEGIEERLAELADAHMTAKMERDDPAIWRQVEKSILLDRLDHHWKDHLATLDALRQVVFLRAYAQKTPINEYKQEAFGLFDSMLSAIREDVTRILAISELRMPEPIQEPSLPELPDFLTGHIDPLTGLDNSNDGDGSALNPALFGSLAGSPQATASPGGTAENPYAHMELSRNALCPCGSGNKYKHCHGALV